MKVFNHKEQINIWPPITVSVMDTMSSTNTTGPIFKKCSCTSYQTPQLKLEIKNKKIVYQFLDNHLIDKLFEIKKTDCTKPFVKLIQ